MYVTKKSTPKASKIYIKMLFKTVNCRHSRISLYPNFQGVTGMAAENPGDMSAVEIGRCLLCHVPSRHILWAERPLAPSDGSCHVWSLG